MIGYSDIEDVGADDRDDREEKKEYSRELMHDDWRRRKLN